MSYKNYIAGIVASVAFAGCSNFLDEIPDNRTQITTPENARDLLVFAYPSANNFYLMEAMTDNFADTKFTKNTSVDNTGYFKFEVDTQESWDSPSEFWTASYKAIAQANQAIESIEKMNVKDNVKNPILGEALLARAYNHWMLAMTFCQAYDPSTASNELGIPYNIEPEKELIKDYKRGTLQEVYDKIEADILRALPLVEDRKDKAKFHFNKDAAAALATRFYAFKGDWDKVMQYSDRLGDYPNTLRDLKAVDSKSSTEMSQIYAEATNPVNLLVSSTRTQIGRVYGSIRFGISDVVMGQRVSATYNPFNVNYMYKTLWRGDDAYLNPKYYEYFVYSNQGAGSGQPYVAHALLTTDEQYLYRIEATIKKGDFDKAAKMMGFFAKSRSTGNQNENTVTSARILQKAGNSSEYQPFYDLTEDQRKMFKFVAEMRRSEFLMSGMRMYDIKRFNLPVVHKDLITGETFTLTAKDNKKAVQLPNSALTILTPNPR